MTDHYIAGGKKKLSAGQRRDEKKIIKSNHTTNSNQNQRVYSGFSNSLLVPQVHVMTSRPKLRWRNLRKFQLISKIHIKRKYNEQPIKFTFQFVCCLCDVFANSKLLNHI